MLENWGEGYYCSPACPGLGLPLGPAHPKLVTQNHANAVMSLFDKFRSLAHAEAQLASLPVMPIATPIDEVLSATRGIIAGREVILAGTNNYLGLTFHTEIVAAAKNALTLHGTGTTGSRMASGSYASHRLLEDEFASAYGWPAAVMCSTGYQTNLAALSALAGPGDYLVIDADCHASIYDGCRLSNAETIRFRHNDPGNLDRRLDRLGSRAKNALIVVEGLYSMLGDRAPLAEFVEVKNRHGAWLLVDEAHSFGVFGRKGLGLAEHAGLLDQVDFVTGTFSKSLAGIGGFCASRHPELSWMRLASRPYIFTASPSPASVASTRKALEVVLDGEELRAALWRNIHAVYDGLLALDYDLGTTEPGPVAALVLPDRYTALDYWNRLLDAGVYTNLMIPPATPNGLHLLRLSLSAAHSPAEIDHILSALRDLRRPVEYVAAGAGR
jgi:8-amino-7-oxononanoate synthase